MVFRVNIDKSIQASAVLLQLASGTQMSYMRLLKLLYLADRESLQKTGRPITGDQAVAMDHGPVLSSLYNVIKGEHIDAPRWSRFIQRSGYAVQLAEIAGNDQLSRFEIATLREISDKYARYSDWDLVEEVLHELPEWKNNRPPKGSSTAIPLRDILKAVGRGDDADGIIQEAVDEAAFDRFWDGIPPAASEMDAAG